MEKDTRFMIIGEWYSGTKHQLSSDYERPLRNSIHRSAISWTPLSDTGYLSHKTNTTFTRVNVDAWVKAVLKDCLSLRVIHIVKVMGNNSDDTRRHTR